MLPHVPPKFILKGDQWPVLGGNNVWRGVWQVHDLVHEADYHETSGMLEGACRPPGEPFIGWEKIVYAR
jgi:hypothetical protein